MKKIEAKKIITVSDTHSEAWAFNKILKIIDDPIEKDTQFVFIGDYIDRGHNSYESFLKLEELSKYERFHIIIGNHDDFLYKALGIIDTDVVDWVTNLKLWICNGGLKTLEQLLFKDKNVNYYELDNNHAIASSQLVKLYEINSNNLSVEEEYNIYKPIFDSIWTLTNNDDLINRIKKIYEKSHYGMQFVVKGKVLGFAHSGMPDNVWGKINVVRKNKFIKDCDAVIMGHWGIHDKQDKDYVTSRIVQQDAYNSYYRILDVNTFIQKEDGIKGKHESRKIVMIDANSKSFNGKAYNPFDAKQNIVVLTEKVIEDIFLYDNTLRYYKDNAKKYVENTKDIDMSEHYQLFLSKIGEPSTKIKTILDLGCGSGRDSYNFQEMGYKVKSIDNNEKFKTLARREFGVNVEVMDITDISYNCGYDGVWASASLLHLQENELIKTLKSIHNALKPNGVFYASFKYGNGLRTDEHNRFFNDKNEDFINVLKDMKFNDISYKITTSVTGEKFIEFNCEK